MDNDIRAEIIHIKTVRDSAGKIVSSTSHTEILTHKCQNCGTDLRAKKLTFFRDNKWLCDFCHKLPDYILNCK